ncbi:MAG: M16 family metallopeptidase [Methylophilaceae bacterium]
MKTIRICIFLLSGFVAWSSQAAVKIERWQTVEGSDVYFVENHDLPILDMSVGFPAGSARNTKATAGLAGVTRHMMSLGAAGMNEEDITNAFADIGAEFGGSVDADQAAFTLRTLTSEKDKAITVFNKVLHQPDFPDAVLAREKTRIIAGLQEAATQPDSIVNKAFMQALYGSHPYGLPEEGEEETIKAISRQAMQDFYQQFYSVKSATIVLIGDISKSEAEAIAGKVSAGLPQTPAVEALPSVSLPSVANEQKIPHPASQAHILMGYLGVKRGDADYFPLYVGNYILGGGGFVSRLTEEVREKRGLVYSVYSYFIPMAQQGPFQIGLQTKKEQAGEALKVVNETLKRFMTNGITNDELKAAKSNITGGFPMRLDSNKEILGYVAMIGFYKLPLTYLDDFNQEVNKVTAAQIKDAFNRRLNLDHFTSVIVGAND